MGVEGKDIYNSGCHNYCFFDWMRLHKETYGKDWTWNHSCFGLTHARLVLKDELGTIAKYSFDVRNDGASVHSDSWQVTWKEDSVEAVISGAEQNDEQYILYFDGKTDSNQLAYKSELLRIAGEIAQNTDAEIKFYLQSYYDGMSYNIPRQTTHYGTWEE